MPTLPLRILTAPALAAFLLIPGAALANEAFDMIRTFYTAVDAGDAATYAPMIAEDFVDHDRPAAAPAQATDAQVILNLFSELAAGFPGAIHTLDLVEPISPDADGNPRAMVRWTFEGQHTGPFFGAPASGNDISINGIDVFSAQNGQFIKQWHVEELIDLFAQIAPR